MWVRWWRQWGVWAWNPFDLNLPSQCFLKGNHDGCGLCVCVCVCESSPAKWERLYLLWYFRSPTSAVRKIIRLSWRTHHIPHMKKKESAEEYVLLSYLCLIAQKWLIIKIWLCFYLWTWAWALLNSNSKNALKIPTWINSVTFRMRRVRQCLGTWANVWLIYGMLYVLCV